MTKLATSVRKADMLQAIELGKRDHFRELLAKVLDCQPSQEAIKKAANKNPVAFFNSLKTVSELAGYQTGSTEVHNNVLVNISGMSDSALMAELEKLQAAMIGNDILPADDKEKTLESLSGPLDPCG